MIRTVSQLNELAGRLLNRAASRSLQSQPALCSDLRAAGLLLRDLAQRCALRDDRVSEPRQRPH